MCSLKSSNLENMGHERVESTQSHKKNSSLLKVQILIVDDDATSLAIISSMLKTCSLQDCFVELSVVTVKNALDALSTLRSKHEAFDLVLTDLHMPGMSGLELQKQIDEEFKIPVIIISSDDKGSVILKSLESGAVFYMVKPVNQKDLKNVWQYAVASKKGKSIVTEEMGNNDEEASSSNEKNQCDEDVNSALSANEESNNKKKKGKKRARDDHQDEDASSAPKKAKVVWTNSLHNRFLQAINHIGLEKAVPKKILEFMNVPGLTRENVASHLQKYRMFLKKVAERGVWSSETLSERAMRSSFASGYSSMFLKNGHQDYSQFDGSFQHGYGVNISGLGTSNVGFSRYHSQKASSSNSLPPIRFGQSNMFGNNPSSFQQRPMFGNTPPLYQPNRLRSGSLTTNNNGLNMSANTFGLMSNGTSPMQMYQQENQATYFQIGNLGTFNGSYPSSLNPNGNYAGIRLNSEGELIGSGQVSGFNGSSLMNWNRNNNNNLNNSSEIYGYLTSQEGPYSANYLSPAITNQENPSMLSPLSQHNNNNNNANLGGTGGENDFAFNLLNDSSNFDTMPNNQQHLGEADLSELLFTTPYQQQCVEGSSSYNAQVNSVSELLNAEFSSSCTISDKTPSSEQSSSQFQERGEIVNRFGGNTNYYPSFEQLQDNNNGEPIDSELNVNAELEDQAWGDDFLDFLIRNEPY